MSRSTTTYPMLAGSHVIRGHRQSAQIEFARWGPPLFQGGPGATGRSNWSFDTIIESIRTTLLTLPGATTIRTGHGDSTSIGDELPHLEVWIAKGS